MACVAINIVTYNNASRVDACLRSVFKQEYRDFQVTVIDNGSTDDTLARLHDWKGRGVRVISLEQNHYYARAHNIAIRETNSDFILTLNPDVVMRSDYLSRALPAFRLALSIGSVNGKLLLSTGGENEAGRPIGETWIDGAGLTMLKSRRPYLRGNRQRSDTNCLGAQYIFGADGACALYRRAMLDDVAVEGEYLDEDFVMYREDVDLAWRGQLYGWDTYYVPNAVGHHRRSFHLGQSRRSISPYLKRQSVKNGWLLLIKNDSLHSLMHDIPYVAPYEAKIVAGMLAFEHSSLGAIPDVLALLPRMRRKRAHIQAKRRRSEEDIHRWFE
jgi:GT2 family glycosyltransferase